MGATCGTCAVGTCTSGGTSCALWNAYLTGRPVGGIALDDTTAYVVIQGGFDPGSVYTIDRTSGVATQVALSDTFVESVAINSTHVFWSEVGTLRRMAKAGGSAQALASTGSTEGFCQELVANDQYVFCALYDFSGPNGHGLLRIGLDGSVSTVFKSSEVPENLIIDGDRIYWQEPGSYIGYSPIAGQGQNVFHDANVTSFSVTGGYVYWRESGGAGTYRKPVGGGGQAELYTSHRLFKFVEGAFYVIDQLNIRLLRPDLTVSAPLVVAEDYWPSISYRTGDAKGLFISDGQDGSTTTRVREIRLNE
ncbi:hypothetical protein [Polyangium fumosum]|uniref:Prolow-density lipoprotein receptor-related protein 1-like beta-propeller domain-containing protein n=1 Tax=Polyangium fumosum TaxID=889272 RepID=A0A4U1J9I7_9BACT|nr:hypothetical protein [Polyangium fumosum]TKD03542.1 hypothetical protein E8A74_25415 [Polyangium fumosum]